MVKSKLVEVDEKTVEGRVGSYKKIEEEAVGGYKRLEQGAEEGRNNMTDIFK